MSVLVKLARRELVSSVTGWAGDRIYFGKLDLPAIAALIPKDRKAGPVNVKAVKLNGAGGYANGHDHAAVATA